MAACDTGGGGGGSGSGSGSSGGGGVALPVIFENGKFLDGVSVKTGDYTTYSYESDKTLKKGYVALKNSYIEVDYAGGQKFHEYDTSGTNIVGHFHLDFTFSKTLDIKGYDGLQIELESVHKTVDNMYIGVDIYDAVGKTTVSWGDVNNLSFATSHDDTNNVGPNIGWFDKTVAPDGGGYSLAYKDFTRKINGMNFWHGINQDALTNNWPGLNTWKIKSVKFIKK
jgi:hypothetical protein